MHDKGKATLRESSKERFADEKKEMEHELSKNRTVLTKLLNEHYTYKTTSKQRGQFIVKFQHPTTHKMEKLNFQFEPNLKSLENRWQKE